MSDKIMRDILKLLTDEFCARTGYSRGTVSHKIHGKANFLDDFFAGKISPNGKSIGPMLSHYFVMLDKLRNQWPEDAPWPNGEKMQRLLTQLVQEVMKPPKSVEKHKP